jgi:hypothetical protein
VRRSHPKDEAMTMPPLPEPDRELVYNESKGYTAPIWFERKMRAYGEACAAAERERCAQVALELGGNRCDVLADAIRGMKS